jgi:hypothetical protein
MLCADCFMRNFPFISGVDSMSVLRPVSVETLASIPWMSAKSLSHAMREVSLRGPNDSETWKQLMSRADVIAASFNPKHAALVLNSLARIKKLGYVEDLFLKRFINRFLPNVVPDCNALDSAQIVHAISMFPNQASKEVVDQILHRIQEMVPHMDHPSLCMTAVGVSHLSHPPLSVVQVIVTHGLTQECTGRFLSQLLILASLHPHEMKLYIDQILSRLSDRTDVFPTRRLVKCIDLLERRNFIMNSNLVSRVSDNRVGEVS